MKHTVTIDETTALVCYMYNGVQVLWEKQWIQYDRYVSFVKDLQILMVIDYDYAFDLVNATLKPEYNPPFIGNPDFHLSHRLNLLWKDPEWYSTYFEEPVPTSKPPYLWPSPQKIGLETEPKP